MIQMQTHFPILGMMKCLPVVSFVLSQISISCKYIDCLQLQVHKFYLSLTFISLIQFAKEREKRTN